MGVDVQTMMDVQQFLFYEAQLLDEHRYHEWIELFTDDTHYWMPTRKTVGPDDLAHEFANEFEQSFFDEDKAALEMRIRKLDSGYSWSEDPPSRTRHMLTNIRIRDGGTDTELTTDSYFFIYRNRLSSDHPADEDMWVGSREDVLRKVDGSWKIAKRKILLDQVVLRSKNLSTFF